jgi:iron complex outermembrane receptor protein
LNEIYGNSAILQTASFINSDAKSSVDRFTWRAGADWDVTDTNFIYANYETGFKAGGFFFSADNSTYRPEEIRAWTVGSKNRFFHNKFQLNIEGFYWRYSDQQISILGQDSKGDIILPTLNVGNSNNKGFEIEAQLAATRSTLLKADVQYLDAQYKSFEYQIPNQGPPLTGCRASGLSTPSITLNCSGFRPPNAPEWTVNLGAQQTIALSSGANLVLDARGHYQTRTLVGLDFLPQETQVGYWLADGSITFNAADDHLFVTAFINNAFNKSVITGTIIVPLGTFSEGQLNNPRTYGLRVGYRF